MLILAVQSEAAPVTFEFDARITSVSEGSGGGAGVPLSVGDGDLLTGQLTFEPGSRGSYSADYPQSLGFEVRLGDLVLSADRYVLFVENDSVAITGSIPPTIIGPTDSQGLWCGGDPCGVVPGHPDVEWRVFLSLADDEATLLDDASLTGDLETWNAYPRRTLTLSLFRRNAVLTTLYSQEVGQFTAAPEARLPVLMALTAVFRLAWIAHARKVRVG